MERDRIICARLFGLAQRLPIDSVDSRSCMGLVGAARSAAVEDDRLADLLQAAVVPSPTVGSAGRRDAWSHFSNVSGVFGHRSHIAGSCYYQNSPCRKIAGIPFVK